MPARLWAKTEPAFDVHEKSEIPIRNMFMRTLGRQAQNVGSNAFPIARSDTAPV
jgi:hypothetical protein